MEITAYGHRFRIHQEDGEYYGTELLMRHGETGSLFRFGEESAGTKRLFDLLPIFQTGKHNAVFLVDDLDQSLHPILLRELLRQFFLQTRGRPCQLIATLRDSKVMDPTAMHQDEIRYVNNTSQHGSVLSCFEGSSHCLVPLECL